MWWCNCYYDDWFLTECFCFYVAAGQSSPQYEQYPQCALDTEMKSHYAVDVHSVFLITQLPTCVTKCNLSYSHAELADADSKYRHKKVGAFSQGISDGNTDPDGKIYKHHYVILQCSTEQMKDLMWASSALMIIVMGWDGFIMINPVHLFVQYILRDNISSTTIKRWIRRYSRLLAMTAWLITK